MRAGGVKTMILQAIEPRLLMGLGLAASIIGHLALTLGLLFADAHPFEQMPSQAIAVDIVAPEREKPRKGRQSPCTIPTSAPCFIPRPPVLITPEKGRRFS